MITGLDWVHLRTHLSYVNAYACFIRKYSQKMEYHFFVGHAHYRTGILGSAHIYGGTATGYNYNYIGFVYALYVYITTDTFPVNFTLYDTINKQKK